MVMVASHSLLPFINGTFLKKEELLRAHQDIITSCCFHQNGSLFVSGGDDKTIKLWNTNDWSLVSSIVAPKKITTVLLHGDYIIWADKFGGVYRVSVDDSMSSINVKDMEDYFLLGHYSWITGMCINNEYIFTGDKDGKVRISSYPDSYDIHGYCFGHTQFVSSMVLVQSFGNNQWLITGGGDGTIRLYNYQSCQEIQEIFVDDEYRIIYSLKFNGTDTIACFMEGVDSVLFYELKDSYPYLTLKNTIKIPQPTYAIEFINDKVLWITQGNHIIEATFDQNEWSTKTIQFNQEVNEIVNGNLTDELKAKLSKEQQRKNTSSSKKLKANTKNTTNMEIDLDGGHDDNK